MIRWSDRPGKVAVYGALGLLPILAPPPAAAPAELLPAQHDAAGADAPAPADLGRCNLLDGAYAPVRNRKSAGLLQLAAAAGLLGIGAVAGASCYELRTLEPEKQQTERAMRTLFARCFPAQPCLDRPRSQLTALLSAARPGPVGPAGFARCLDALRQTAPRLGARLAAVAFRDNAMTVLRSVRGLSSRDRLQRACNQLPGSRAELRSCGARNGKVTGRFRLTSGGAR